MWFAVVGTEKVVPALAASALAVNRKNELQQMAAAVDRMVAVWLAL